MQVYTIVIKFIENMFFKAKKNIDFINFFLNKSLFHLIKRIKFRLDK